MVEFGTSSAFRGWVGVRVLGYGFGVRGRKVKSRYCALASDLVRASLQAFLSKSFAASRFARTVGGYHPSMQCMEMFAVCLTLRPKYVSYLRPSVLWDVLPSAKRSEGCLGSQGFVVRET